MAGSRRARRATETAVPEQDMTTTTTTAATTTDDGAKTAEERAIDRESLEDYNGDIQDRLVDLVSRIRGDEPPRDAAADARDQRRELIDAIVSYLELQARAALPQDKMRAEVLTITHRFDRLDGCPAAERAAVYRKDTSYYVNQTRILHHRQLARERKEVSRSE